MVFGTMDDKKEKHSLGHRGLPVVLLLDLAMVI
jgi:hypothetical protein